MNFLYMLKEILTELLYKLCIWRDDEEDDSSYAVPPYMPPPRGLNGSINAEAALLFEEDRIVLLIDHDFMDIPSWVEGNKETRSLNIVQMSGAIATPKLLLPSAEADRWLKTKRLALVTGAGQEKLMHYISFKVQ